MFTDKNPVIIFRLRVHPCVIGFMKLLTSILLVLGVAWLFHGGEAVAQGAATYVVTFLSSWSATTHPQGFPSNPHFSGLIGATHDSTVAFWTAGEPASVADLHPTGLRLHVLAPVSIKGETAWYCAPLSV